LGYFGAKFYCYGVVRPPPEKAVGGTLIKIDLHDEMATETGLMEGDAAIHTAVNLIGSDGSAAAFSFLGRKTDPYSECAFAADHKRGVLLGPGTGAKSPLKWTF
jgi:hypothetical protein